MTRLPKRASLETAALMVAAGLLLGILYIGPLEFSVRGLVASAMAGLAFVAALAGGSRVRHQSWSASALALTCGVAGGVGGAVWALIMHRDYLAPVALGAGIATIWMAVETRGFKNA